MSQLKIAATILWFASTANHPKPMHSIDYVRIYAAEHNSTITERKHNGWVWIEMKGSDIFGVGRSEEAAAEDFLGCADLMDHEQNQPLPKAQKPDCSKTDCI